MKKLTKINSKGNGIENLKRRFRNGLTKCFPMIRNKNELNAIISVARLVDFGICSHMFTNFWKRVIYLKLKVKNLHRKS
jgi:hypothetical protein